MIRVFACLLGWLALVSASPAPQPVALDLILGDTLPQKLSDFRFFTDIAASRPNARVQPYHINTPLFSDYAEKYRFLYVPPGKTAAYRDGGLIDLPVGSALIKTFGFAADLRRPHDDVTIIETRVMLRRANGWVALPYVWNADHSEATLRRGGTRVPARWIDAAGNPRAISYAVPNQNQCKGCHALYEAIVPIGPKARNLNDGAQLQALVAAGMLDRAPLDAPRLPRWDDPATGTIDQRARAYLDVNCAHCHNRHAAASNSGLYLEYDERDPVARGVMKTPTAAGRGSGGHAHAIEPGMPEKSYLLFRMESLDPGIAMPELGRATVHDEAIGLLSAYIAAMPKREGQ